MRPFFWIDSPDASYLQYNAGGVAVVRANGELVIRWRRSEVFGRCCSVGQGKRYVERWIGARMCPRQKTLT
ncbi:hypothetical protein N799_09950 [Lysobacter arseniciresistens ZS79]|uniref:Uncharacterized protein n=1 Tax=Lysobacter arseniciresistens ZS79 TaxID=913325 RepID=A0A0A0EVP1_9GAMM|nr:hypothetical protein [Lysobacter arseniciresistens]KGM54193.1 hypothetical protein N799_09950 [Lysobacter arseniciresistens ZS79]